MSRFVQFITRKRTRSAGSRLLGKAGPALLALVLVCAMLGGNFTSAAAAGTTYYVYGPTGHSCSDAGPGTSQSAPWCTLFKAYSTAVNPGDTVIVLGGTYAESVFPASGTAGSPITFKAQPALGATITGALPAGSAFSMSGASYIVIDGFNITETRGPGIYAESSNHITITNNQVTYAGHLAGGTSHQQGMKLKGLTDSLISGNVVHHNSCTGIRLTNASNNNTISNNVIYYSSSTIAEPTVVISDAAGIQVDDSTGNIILHNDVHGNEDSGINLYVGTLGTGSSGNTIVGNLAYGNGDHGIDSNTSPSNFIIGNTVQGNFTSGINLEANSAGSTIANNIVSQNGMNPGERKGGNIYPDSTSLPTVMDYNLYYQSSGTALQVNYNGEPYLTLAAFKAAVPAMEVHGLQFSPLFAAPGAPAPVDQAAYDVTGDYHILGGSKAIDSANSGLANWPLTDFEGTARFDDPSTVNTGAGTRTYDDRGAYEFVRGTTSTVVNCGAGTPSLTYGAGISCVATVTRLTGPVIALTGTVAWTTGGAGGFVTTPCTLAGTPATCSVVYTPTAVGVSPHLITASYAGDANFAPSTGTQNVTVTPKALSMTGLSVPASKVYNATTAAVVTGTPALLPSETFGTGTTLDGKPYTGDDVSIAGVATGTYNSKDVLSANTVTFGGLSLTGAKSTSYTLTIQAPSPATITPKALTMSGLTVPASRPYDGTLVAVVSGTPQLGPAEAPGAGTALDGLRYTGDTVNFTGTAVGTYNSKDVATATTVTFSGLALGGAQGADYSLTMQGPAPATITRKDLTASATGVNKVYDGTLAATVNLSVNKVGTEDVTAHYTAAAFATKDVADGIAVDVSGITITGTAIANYNLLNTTASTTANITKAPLTLTANDAYKRFATVLTFAGTEYTINPATPLLNGDMISSVTLSSPGQPIDAAQGTYGIEISDAVGVGLGNYNINYVNGTLTVGDQNIPPVITEGESRAVTMTVNGVPTAFALTLHSTDAELDIPAWTISTPALHGTASVPASNTGNEMAIGYAPAKNYFGKDSFVVTADDGFGGTDTITVNVTVSPRIASFKSVGTYDGWVLESGELTNKGNAMNSAATTFSLGDEKAKKQYRGILSFNTVLPAGAKITSVTLKIKTSSTAAIANSMFQTFGNIVVDLKKGSLGAIGLEFADFQNPATKNGAFLIKNAPVAGWYSGTMGAPADTLINKAGVTQLRLRFTLDDNNNLIANILNFYSGNAPLANRPVLTIQYYVPLP